MLEQTTPSRSVHSLFVEWLEHERPGMTSEVHRDYERAVREADREGVRVA